MCMLCDILYNNFVNKSKNLFVGNNERTAVDKSDQMSYYNNYNVSEV